VRKFQKIKIDFKAKTRKMILFKIVSDAIIGPGPTNWIGVVSANMGKTRVRLYFPHITQSRLMIQGLFLLTFLLKELKLSMNKMKFKYWENSELCFTKSKTA